MKNIPFAAFACAILAGPLFAQQSDDLDMISLRWMTGSIPAEGAFVADVTFESTNPAPVKIRLGWFGAIGRLHESYADIGAVFGTDTYALGFPRPVYDGFVQSKMIEIMPRFGLGTVGVSRSRTTHGTMTQAKYLPYGVSFHHEGGPVYGASLHAVPDYDDIILGLGAAYQEGASRYEAAIETVWYGDGGEAVNVKLGMRLSLGDWGQAGVSLYAPQANGMRPVAEMFGSWHLTRSTDLTAMLRKPVDNGPVTLAVGSQYLLADGLALEGGAAGSHDQWTIELGASYSF